MTSVDEAMREAITLATSPDAPRGENPRVGCVILDDRGVVVGRGYHHGAGTPHAEIEALRDAGPSARGATAVVTLEPCRHVGRTGPCTQALIDAGIRRVVFAQSDPTTLAGGGAQVLRDAGVDVEGGLRAAEALAVNRAWTHVQRTGRPLVTVKTAMSLDGRVAGPDGGPTPISSPGSRRMAHALRAECDAILVGTGTVLIDDPQLTVRDEQGRAMPRQPLRVVMGERALESGLRVFDDSAPTVHLRTHDPHAVLAALVERGVQHLLVEGGPTVVAAFLEAGLVDRVMWVIAPVLLGAGPVSLPPLAIERNVVVEDVVQVEDDVVVIGSVVTS